MRAIRLNIFMGTVRDLGVRALRGSGWDTSTGSYLVSFLVRPRDRASNSVTARAAAVKGWPSRRRRGMRWGIA